MAVSSDISIPPELVDMIIDHLHDDKHSLATCGRICRQWVPSSRKHLFFSITLPSSDSKIMNLFLDLLDCPLTNIPPHVRNLTVQGRGFGYALQWSREDISRLAQRLDAIDSLSFVMMSCRVMTPDFRSATLPLFNRVTNLRMQLVYFDNHVDFTNLICMFPSLQELFLSWIVFPLPHFTTTMDLPMSLRAFHVVGPRTQYILDTFFSGKRIYALDTINLKLMVSDVLSIATFLRDVGSQLRHLHLDVGDTILPALDLGYNTQLQSVRFMALGGPKMYGRNALAPLILQISSPSIQSVEFCLEPFDDLDELVHVLNFSSLEHIFSSPTFSQLRRIQFSFGARQTSSVEDASKFISQNLPMCFARGILAFKTS